VLFGWTALGEGSVLVASCGARSWTAIWSYSRKPASPPVPSPSRRAIHGAIRLGARPPRAFRALGQAAGSGVEVYGESQARPVFSAEFDLPPEKAAAMAAAELRLAPETAAIALESLLPAPRVNPVEKRSGAHALPYARRSQALARVSRRRRTCYHPKRRASASRGIFIPTAVVAAALLIVLGATLAWPGYEERQYLKELNAEIAQLRPAAARAVALDRPDRSHRARSRLMDEFRTRTRSDLDAINELSRCFRCRRGSAPWSCRATEP